MRVINQEIRCVSYMLNILGLRVFEGRCELIAKHGDQWVPIGNARELPLVSCPNDIVTNIRLSTSMLCDTISGVAIADNRTAGGVDAVGSVA